MIYEPMPMHIHTCHQPGGSMEGHIYNASRLGMRYIRFTDHDTRTGEKKNQVKGFDFSKGTAIINEPPTVKHGFEFFGNCEHAIKDGALELSFSSESGEYETAGTYFISSGNSHTVSLLAETTVTLGMKFELFGDAHIYLDVRLSQRPPEHIPAHIFYSTGGIVERTPNTVVLPLVACEGGLYRLKLSDDARELHEIGGLDNVFDTVTVTVMTRRGGEARLTLDKFEIDAKYGYNEVIERQRVLAEEIGARYGVKPIVTTEISGAGQHKNVFSTAVPVIDYKALGYRVSERDAVLHVKRHGGIFAYNHPFENDKYKKIYKERSLTEDERMTYVINEAASLISSRVLGADLIEVGFPEGRRGFGLSDHLRLWDTVSLAGIFITGYGDSDSHKNHLSWYNGNNFASWIGVPENIPYPVPEEELIEAMKRGRVYMGDPVFLKFGVRLDSEGTEMGSVVYSSKREHSVRLALFGIEAGYRVRLVADGREALSAVSDSSGELILELDYKNEYPLGIVRAEAYNPDGRCIMLTNPIYFVIKDEYMGELPKNRIYELD